MRRKLGNLIHGPIQELDKATEYDTLLFIETDKEAASRTRAAAKMYIMRNDFDLCTHVVENCIYIMQNRDVMDVIREIDIREKD